MRRRRILSGIAIALALCLVGATLVLAATSTTLLGYQIDFRGYVDNGNGTSTWTYAVTANGDEQYGLSQLSLGIGTCYTAITAPEDGSRYKTPTNPAFGCGSTYNCEETRCAVAQGTDPSTGATGIKFDCTPQLDDDSVLPRTQMFQVTVSGVPGVAGIVPVSMKAGLPAATGAVTGPACGFSNPGVVPLLLRFLRPQ